MLLKNKIIKLLHSYYIGTQINKLLNKCNNFCTTNGLFNYLTESESVGSESVGSIDKHSILLENISGVLFSRLK